MKFNQLSERNQIVDTMNRVYYNGLTTTSGGNISIINENQDIYITPSGKDKGNLKESDIVLMKASGEKEGKGKPSVEYPFHKNIYDKRTDIKAILHAHPSGLVAISAARLVPKIELIASLKTLIPRISIAKYALPGSKVLGDNIAKEFEKGNDVVILENHGVVIGANHLQRAYLVLEALEFYVITQIHALSLKVNFLYNDKMSIPNGIQTDQTYKNDLIHGRKDIINIIKRSYNQRLFTGFSGTISKRVNNHDFIITPKNLDRIEIEKSDLVYVKDGMVESNKKACETMMLHHDIYKNHPEINSIMIATPSHIMAFAISDKVFDSHIIPEGYIMLREVQKCKPTQYDDIVNTISKNTPIILVENNFVIVAGENLLQTFDRLEVLEFGANALIKANQFNKIYNITEQEIKEINTHFDVW